MCGPSESNDAEPSTDGESADDSDEQIQENGLPGLIEHFVGRDVKARIKNAAPTPAAAVENGIKTLSRDKQKLIRRLGRETTLPDQPDDFDDARDLAESDAMLKGASKPVDDFNQRIAEQQPAMSRSPPAPQGSSAEVSEQEERESDMTESKPQVTPSLGVLQIAFDRMRPSRTSPQTAIITIGSKTTTSVLGSSSLSKRREIDTPPSTPVRTKLLANDSARQKFSSSMRSFAAPGSQLINTIGKPQSKSRISVDYVKGGSDDEESLDASTAMSADSDEEDVEQDAKDGTPETGDGQVRENEELMPLEDGADRDYLDEEEKKAREDAKVAGLIRQAEKRSAIPSEDNRKCAHQILKGAGRKDSTTSLIQLIEASVERIDNQLRSLEAALQKTSTPTQKPKSETPAPTDETSPEERLSLTVTKTDFATMQISGQFNLGFILANRSNTDLFIIDQHASDEKYNFERLQSTTIVQNQRLVQPRTLHLTAVEEEIVLENNDALLRNGFLVDINTSGDVPVGQRCKLLSLPMSREVNFDTTDLEELITLLADSPTSSSSDHVPRPSKVRRMFAMRACRSSVMIGKTLTIRQMRVLVRHMGEIDKPWNCPHGRPTMRHVCGLEGWQGWGEGEGIAGMEEEQMGVDWRSWVEGVREKQEEEEEEEEGEEEGVDDDIMEDRPDEDGVEAERCEPDE